MGSHFSACFYWETNNSLSGKKNENTDLFNYLEENGFNNIQNYIPLYSKFFSLDERNFNNINLNNRHSITSIVERSDNNNFKIKCVDEKTDALQPHDSFFKFSPLLDPVKFMVGKYKHIDKDIICSLPKTIDNSCCKKVLDINNSAYVDSFFSYLSSKLLNEHGFIHGTNFYGSFLGIQEEFKLKMNEMNNN